MFTEYRDRITQLKAEDAHFSRLLHRYTALEQHVRNMEGSIRPVAGIVLESFKREKQALSEELYAMLGKSPAA